MDDACRRVQENWRSDLKPTTLELIQRLYNAEDPCTMGTGIVGGHLHIVLDDGNVEDHHVQWYLDLAKEEGCHTCETLATRLLELSEEERQSLYVEGGY